MGIFRFLAAAAVLLLPLYPAQPVRARKAMVVSREANATEAGLAVLKAGGNAVDAAVAVGFALAVTHPSAGNLGGGGFMLIRFADGRKTFIDFREMAPAKASRDMYLDASGNPTRDSLTGWRASGVPGTVRGLELAHKKYGKLAWAPLVTPAANLAMKGFALPYGTARSLKAARNLAQFPESKRIFQRNGEYFEPGDVLKQPELGAVLERIAHAGPNDFYEGETAKRLAAEMTAHGGAITLDDLKNFKAVERVPLEGKYRGYDIITAPPPSSGGIGILQMLAVLEKTKFAETGAGSAQSVHYMAEAMRRYYADRSEFLGDPDFFKVPTKQLLDKKYTDKLRTSIDPSRATPSDAVKHGDLNLKESTETTHYSIVDAEGNAVAVTYTLNGGYGSGVAIPGLGFLMNNEMDDFTAKPGSPNTFGLVQGAANKIEPGKRMLSSMSPTIVLDDKGDAVMIAGAGGGPRIITAVWQTISNVLDFKMHADAADAAPRIHHQHLPDLVDVEVDAIDAATEAALKAAGYTVSWGGSTPAPGVKMSFYGAVTTIVRAGDHWEGSSDRRGGGAAAGD